MISQQHTEGALLSEVVKVLNTTGQAVLKTQLGIARTFYQRRSGNLISQLSNNPFTVKNKTSSPTLVINYPKHIRFLDMKFNGQGVLKENYHAIYNKPLYGFIYGYAYMQLRYGLSANINQAFIDPLQTAIETQPIWV